MSITSPVIGSVFGPVISPTIGIGGAQIRPIFITNLAYTLTPFITAGSGYTYSRGAAGGTIIDFEKIVKNIGDEESMHDGVRHVRNIHSTDMRLWSLTGYGVSGQVVYDQPDPLGGNTAAIVSVRGAATPTFVASGIAFLEIDHDYIGELWLKFVPVIEELSDLNALELTLDSALAALPKIDLTVMDLSEWTRLTAGVFTHAAADGPFTQMKVNGVAEFASYDLHIAYGQFEEVTGQDNQNPSRDVSLGVGTGTQIHTDPEFDTFVASGGENDDFNLGASTKIQSGVMQSQGITTTTGKRNFVVGKLYLFEYEIQPTVGIINHTACGNSMGTVSGTYTQVKRAANTNAISLLMGNGTDLSYYRVTEINHGTNVDGTTYYKTENGNTVVNNIVIEASGPSITEEDILGASLWEERTNEFLSSVYDPTNGWGSSFGSITSGQPDSFGGIEGDLFKDNSPIFIAHYTATSPTALTQVGDVTAIIHVAKDTSDDSQITIRAGGTDKGIIDIDWSVSPPVLTDGNTVDAVTIHPIKQLVSGYWEIAFTMDWTAYSGLQSVGVRIFPSTVSAASQFALLHSHSEIQKGSFPTPIIPTSGSTVTRPAALLNYGTENYSDEMTIVGEFYTQSDEKTGTLRILCKFSEEGADVYVQIGIAKNSGAFFAARLNTPDGAAYYSEGGTGVLPAGHHKFACAFSLDGSKCHAFLDGSRVNDTPSNTDSTVAMLGMDKFLVGRIENDSLYFNGNTKLLKVFNEVLSDDLLAEYSS
jgi:hypothetical protein